MSTPTIEAAHAMGTKGGPVVEAERLAFEAWMAGHCWALGATWDGKHYIGEAEKFGDLSPRAMMTRQLWAAWRDRAALSQQPATGEPVAWMHWLNGPVRVFMNKDVAMMELDRLNREYPLDADDRKMRPLVFGDTAPQPAQATQAEVTDATINHVVYEHTKLNPNQSDDVELLTYIRNAARAILALRPERVPMTDAALIRELVEHIERNTCTHDETHRGGVIWEVCDSCGAKWADDEGGKPEFKWPAVVEKARAILALRPAAHPAPSVPATSVPVVVQHRRPVIGWKGETIGYTAWMDGKGLDGWPHRELYDRPAPSVLKDDQIAALVNKVRDIAHMFHDHQSLRERIAIELVPALKASQEVKSNAEPVPDDVVRDAKRYEWLRKADMWPCVFPDYFDPEPLAGSELDEYIDAAMLAAKEGGAA